MFDFDTFEWCRKALKDWGIDDQGCLSVLYGMTACGMGYGEACDSYGEYKDIDGHLVHSGICYQMLSAGCGVQPGTLFRYLAWRWEEEHENRVPAGQGS